VVGTAVVGSGRAGGICLAPVFSEALGLGCVVLVFSSYISLSAHKKAPIYRHQKQTL
jgi:hypothetical protein